MKPEELTIEAVAEAFGGPAKNWHGKCFGVASAIVDEGLVEGEAIYGHYLGPIAKDGFWGQRRGHPFVQHGWVLLPDGRILDPTRFSFENKDPYIYLEDNEDDYDEGGNQFRQAMHAKRPCPDAGGDKPLEWDASQEEAQAFESLTGTPFADFNFEQAFWIGNMPYDEIKGAISLVYTTFARNKLIAIIPMDNWKRAKREGLVEGGY
jgi:hypothetical protein